MATETDVSQAVRLGAVGCVCGCGGVGGWVWMGVCGCVGVCGGGWVGVWGCGWGWVGGGGVYSSITWSVLFEDVVFCGFVLRCTYSHGT